MVNPLLRRAAPREFAERGQVIETTEEIGMFPRLAESVAAELRALSPDRVADKWRQAPVAIRLGFGWADGQQDIPLLSGRLSVTIPALCQRCLEPFDLLLQTEVKLKFCGPGGSDQSGDYEVWELDEAKVRPLDILDEALVMAMPLAPMHRSIDDCGPLAVVHREGDDKVDDKVDDEAAAVRPFADLKSRMRQEE